MGEQINAGSALIMSAVENYSPVEGGREATALFRLTDRLYRARTDHDVHEAALDAIVEALGCQRASILLFDEAGVMQSGPPGSVR